MLLVNNNFSRPDDDPRAFDTTDGSPDRQHRAWATADTAAAGVGLGAPGRLARAGAEHGRLHCTGGAAPPARHGDAARAGADVVAFGPGAGRACAPGAFDLVGCTGGRLSPGGHEGDAD